MFSKQTCLTTAALVAVQTAANPVLVSDQNSQPLVGVNIGGWMVLESWITPSIFYDALGLSLSEGAYIDQYTLCEQKGAELGNQILQAHWDTWVTEDLISDLADRNVKLVRLPIGDWVMKQYDAYTGCTNGAIEQIDWFFDMAAKYDMRVLVDIHGLKDSQNGYESSGRSENISWNAEPNDSLFQHQCAGNWMGTFSWDTMSYTDYNTDNIQWGLDRVQDIMERWGNLDAFYGVSPVNEPWDLSNMTVLKTFYKLARDVVHTSNPAAKFVFHDAFQSNAAFWNDLFDDDDMVNVVLDTHQYLAWEPYHEEIEDYCTAYKTKFSAFAGLKYPMFVGEWSLATDVCCHWLQGFNQSGMQEQMTCEWVDCPDSYLPGDLYMDFDRTAPTLGPYGDSNPWTVLSGQCSRSSTHFSDQDILTLSQCMHQTFADAGVNAQFMWTAHNQLEDKWSYINAYDNGWLADYQ